MLYSALKYFTVKCYTDLKHHIIALLISYNQSENRQSAGSFLQQPIHETFDDDTLVQQLGYHFNATLNM